jgi:hypothetical protein
MPGETEIGGDLGGASRPEHSNHHEVGDLAVGIPDYVHAALHGSASSFAARIEGSRRPRRDGPPSLIVDHPLNPGRHIHSRLDYVTGCATLDCRSLRPALSAATATASVLLGGFLTSAASTAAAAAAAATSAAAAAAARGSTAAAAAAATATAAASGSAGAARRHSGRRSQCQIRSAPTGASGFSTRRGSSGSAAYLPDGLLLGAHAIDVILHALNGGLRGHNPCVGHRRRRRRIDLLLLGRACIAVRKTELLSLEGVAKLTWTSVIVIVWVRWKYLPKRTNVAGVSLLYVEHD